jgi:hypothetical protein
VESLRLVGVCVLIFISCAGLGAAGFWAVTRTDEPITLREVRTIIRAMLSSLVATWILLLVAPARMLWAVGLFFVGYAAVVILVLGIAHYKIVRSSKEKSYE